LRLPAGYADTSPFRSRIETEGDAGDIVLRIDRVRSPWSVRQLEQTLTETQTFEPLPMTRRDGRVSPVARQLILGGTVAADGPTEIRMDYALLDLGQEKLVARYVGSAESMAYNESVLRESLASLQGQVFGPRPMRLPGDAEWSATASIGDVRSLPVPAGWIAAATGPAGCPALPQPSAVTSVFSPEDSTVSMRAALFAADTIVPDTAAVRCSARRGALGATSYVSRADWLGVSYVIEGAFVATPSGQVAQLEVSAPVDNVTAARALLAAWARRVAR
jgi:hypothetical protein